MKRLKALFFFLMAHLVLVASAVTGIEAWLHGPGTAAYAGWTGGLIVAVWTLPLAVFAGCFVGPEVVRPGAAEERPARAMTEAASEAEPGNG